MEPHLLLAGKAWHDVGSEHAVGERLGWVVKAAAAQVGLAPVPCAVEGHRVQIDPAAARRDELYPDRTPVGLHRVTEPAQGAERGRLMLGVDGEVQVAVRTRLATDERIDSQPPATQKRQPS